jgi:hypothetical protein
VPDVFTGDHFVPLHPQAQAFVDTINALERTPMSELTPELARRGLQGLLLPQDLPVGAVTDFDVPGGDGGVPALRRDAARVLHAGTGVR